MNIFELARGLQKIVMPDYYFEFLAAKRDKEKYRGYWQDEQKKTSEVAAWYGAKIARLTHERDAAREENARLRARLQDPTETVSTTK